MESFLEKRWTFVTVRLNGARKKLLLEGVASFGANLRGCDSKKGLVKTDWLSGGKID